MFALQYMYRYEAHPRHSVICRGKNACTQARNGWNHGNSQLRDSGLTFKKVIIASRSFVFSPDSTWQQDPVLRPGSCYRYWSRMRNDWYRIYCLGNKEAHTKKERRRWWRRWTETWRSLNCSKTDFGPEKEFMNPFTAKCGQKQNLTKISEFHLVKFLKTGIMWTYRQRRFISMVQHDRISSTLDS